MKLKICGIKYPDNARQLLTLAPDYLGFIFYKKSPRYVGEPADLDWVKNLPGTTQKVGVFVNEEVEKMIKTAEILGLQVIQLHGEESPEVCHILKKEGLEVWKVFGVDEDFNFEKTRPYTAVCDQFLFDTRGKSRGGNGVAFDWSLLEKYDGKTPFVLSGGIGPDLGSTAFRLSGLASFTTSYALKGADRDSLKAMLPSLAVLDINSRFETEPGLKDINLVKKFKHALFS